jgi:S-adenosylmethionine-diacylglycerol 3-amino-3-carboxypropyl transferase
MAFDTAVENPRTAGLVKRAVHRNRALSIDGLLERIFSFAFRGLVYPQIWEDPMVDMAAMEIKPHHHIVTIASGGCNVLNYITESPARITAVDLNRAHVALTKLKLAGLKSLPTWEDYYRFFGEADERRNIVDYKRYLHAAVDESTRKYWNGRVWTGKKRINGFKSNIYHKGLLGRFIGVGHFLAKAYGCDLKGLLECRSLEQQRSFFETQITPLFQRRFVKWVTDRKVSLYGLGIPPAQY